MAMVESQASSDDSKIEFERDPETGLLIGYKNGKRLGPVITMGDLVADRLRSGE